MFADPQSVTVNAVAKSLPRISMSESGGTFYLHDGTNAFTLKVSPKQGKRNRSTVRLDVSKVGADPFEPATNQPYSMSAYLVFDAPVVGFSGTEITNNIQALVDWLDTPANLAKVIGFES